MLGCARRETKRCMARFLTLACSRAGTMQRRMGLCRSCGTLKSLLSRPTASTMLAARPFAKPPRPLRGISSFWIKNAEVVVENDRITMFRVNGKISFLIEDGH